MPPSLCSGLGGDISGCDIGRGDIHGGSHPWGVASEKVVLQFICMGVRFLSKTVTTTQKTVMSG